MLTAGCPAREDDERAFLLAEFARSSLSASPTQMRPASADASFRRYFRFTLDNGDTVIGMDAPPPQEDCRPFVHVTGLMHAAGLNAPTLLATDVERGYLLLSDLGTQTYLDVLNEGNADHYMRPALAALVQWQASSKPDVLPPYDRAVLQRELDLFPQWYCERHRARTLTAEQQTLWRDLSDAIITRNLAQPQVFVHRDYMPRNLMVSERLPGVLDYQDALFGPITYDIASLCKDAFISWEEERVLDWTIRYWELARKARLPVGDDFGEFYAATEWMGLQRHLKVLGIFARINYRDGKPKYLADTPRFINYVRKVSERYNGLAALRHLLDDIEQAR